MELEPAPASLALALDGDVRIDYGDDEGEYEAEMLDVGDPGAGADAEADAEMGDDSVAGLHEAVMGSPPPPELGDNDDEAPMPDASLSDNPELAYTPPAPAPASAASPSPIAPHPGFSSPPLVQASADGLQLSALGHSAADPSTATSYFVPPTPSQTASPQPRANSTTPPLANGLAATNGNGHHHSPSPPADQPEMHNSEPQPDRATSQSGALEQGKALATQHQHSEDRTQKQDQLVENLGDHLTRVTQRQSQEPAGGGKPAVQENEVTIRQDTDADTGKERVSVEMNQSSTGDKDNGPVQQVNHVKVFNRGDDCASCTHSGGTMTRPTISKDLLSIVDLEQMLDEKRDVETPDDPQAEPGTSAQSLVAPAVLLTLNGVTHSLFQRHSEADENPDARLDPDPTLPVLFGEPKDHELYYDQVESFIEAIHDVFPELASRQDEIVLSFEAIGITLPEDNVYTREVCLFDFDRVHVGCNLPGRLHITLESQARFSTNFNALAAHVANSNAKTGDDEDPYDEETLDELNAEFNSTPIADADDGATVTELPDDAGAETAGADGETKAAAGELGSPEFEDGEWAADVSAYQDAQSEYGVEEETYDGLDDADLAAVIEGAEEDYVLSEAAPEGGESEYVDAEFGSGTTPATSAPETGSGSSGDADATEHEPSAENELDAPAPEPAPEIRVDASGLVAGDALEAENGADDLDVGVDDVVIDYEEVFGTSTLPSPAPLEANEPEPPMSPSPKRSHDVFGGEQLLDGEASSDEVGLSAAKRVRLDDPYPPGPASEPSS